MYPKISSRKTVVIAATEMEIAPCRTAVPEVEFIVGGIGATNTAQALIQAVFTHNPDLIIQVGIAGAIDRTLQLGEAVFVVEDYQADLGAWREITEEFEPFSTPRIKVENSTKLRSVKARSVNTACNPLIAACDAQIESMEGAAFFQIATHYKGMKFAQIRTISNYIDTPRTEWLIPLALSNLPDALKACLEEI